MTNVVTPGAGSELHCPEPVEQIAQLLGGPLPVDWDHPHAIEARQDHLVARAVVAATACVEALIHFHSLAEREAPARLEDAPVAALADALAALDQARRRHTYDTQRSDALEVTECGAAWECGATIAVVVTGLLERLRRDLENEIAAQHGARFLAEWQPRAG